MVSSLLYKTAPPPTGSKEPYPTLILLHGRGSHEDDLLGLVPYLDPRLFAVAPRAPFDFPYGGFTWYDLRETGSPDQTMFSDSYSRLVGFLDDVRAKYPIDPARLFLFGFSMGSVMSLAVALTRPADIAGVIAHSGYIPEASELEFRWRDLGSTSFFIAHGTEDQVIPIRFGRRARELLAATPAPLTYREYPAAHAVTDESLADISHWLTGLIDGGTQG